MSTKSMTYEEALVKMERYCAYQERCHSDVRKKLIQLGVFGDRLEKVMASLIENNFLNEQRFANSYTSGKYRLKAWGRRKIKHALESKSISNYCVQKAMLEINDLEYQAVLHRALHKYLSNLSNLSLFEKRGRLYKYAYNKGYEKEIINIVLNQILGQRIE
ncbi:MAG: RecX family transcriptional regulator [Bacteroidia bacterium]|nr:RecX family transcriptional regulator [Bacteroidia bacterium]